MSALIDEVTAILILGVMVLNLCRGLGLSPVPYLVSTVFAINIGSAATLFGNPIGVLIAFRAGLTFEDFVRWATPVAVSSSWGSNSDSPPILPETAGERQGYNKEQQWNSEIRSRQ